MHSSFRRLLAVLLGFVMLCTLPLFPLQAQTPAPTQPLPTVTPTPTLPEAVGVGEANDRLQWLLQNYGLWSALGLLLLAAVFGFVFALTKKTSEGLVDYFYRVFLGRRLEGRLKSVEAAEEQKQVQRVATKARDAGLTAYLAWLQADDEFRHLPIIPVRGATEREHLLLSEVYVPLRVVERAQMEQFHKLTGGDFDDRGEYRVRAEAFAALEQSQRVYRLLSDAALLPPIVDDDGAGVRRRVSREQQPPAVSFTTHRLLLVGDAGSGKTTTLHYGAFVLAGDFSDSRSEQAKPRLDLHTQRPLLPFYIRLTLVANEIRTKYASPSEARARLDDAPCSLLLDWLDAYICEQTGKNTPLDFPSQRIAAGGCLLMLDGLDETGDAAWREYMQRLIANLVARHPDNRYLIASRPFEGLALPGFDVRHLSPLDRDEMRLLLKNWFNATRTDLSRRARQSVEDQVGHLSDLLDSFPRLFDMATNPLLLTTLALLYQNDSNGLPRERAEIYNRLVPLLLQKWREAQITAGRPGSERPLLYYDESESSVQRHLYEVAASMQEQQRRELRLAGVQDVLRPFYVTARPQWDDGKRDDQITALFDSLALHSGLVQARDRGFTFTHYTLQEYLTARCYDRRPDGIELLLRHWSEERWRETILLAVGHWVGAGDRPEKAKILLTKLLATGEDAALLLAAAALDDADARRVLDLAALLETATARLRLLAFDPSRCPNPVTRNEAATLLDQLDADTRRGLDPAADDYWATPIPAGPFSLGDDNGQYDDEKPAFVYSIAAPYALAMFPVTNRQYGQFLEALDAEARDQRRPRYWPGASFRSGEGNHPVVGISLLDATAFAEWIDREYYGGRGDVRLPTEPEWERAAAYPLHVPAQDPAAGRRTYAWGEYLPSPSGEGAGGQGDLTAPSDSSRIASIPANIAETNIGSTSVVGIFPHGAAACSACDITGNVWEWCSTPFTSYNEIQDKGILLPETLYNLENEVRHNRVRTYVLRGGSWNNNRSDARCGDRLDVNSVPRNVLVGVRLARRLPA